MSDTVSPLTFGEFVDTTDSEQRWQIYNAIAGTGGVAENVNIVGPLDNNGSATNPVATSIYSGNQPIHSSTGSLNITPYDPTGNAYQLNVTDNANAVIAYLTDQSGNAVDNGSGSLNVQQKIPILPKYNQKLITSTSSSIGSATNLINGVVITNSGASNIYLGDYSVTVSNGYILVSGASVGIAVSQTSSIYAVTASGLSSTLSYIGS